MRVFSGGDVRVVAIPLGIRFCGIPFYAFQAPGCVRSSFCPVPSFLPAAIHDAFQCGGHCHGQPIFVCKAGGTATVVPLIPERFPSIGAQEIGNQGSTPPVYQLRCMFTRSHVYLKDSPLMGYFIVEGFLPIPPPSCTCTVGDDDCTFSMINKDLWISCAYVGGCIFHMFCVCACLLA